MKALFVFLLVSGTAFAQSSSRFAVTRNVIAGGGTTFSTSARFQLGSTIGQPLAAAPSSARFSLRGGFWIWPAPILFAPEKAGSNFRFSFQGEPGKTYSPQYVDSLGTLTWQDLPGVVGDGTVKTITNSASNVTKRFYRLSEQ